MKHLTIFCRAFSVEQLSLTSSRFADTAHFWTTNETVSSSTYPGIELLIVNLAQPRSGSAPDDVAY
ncbi:hypothetical protein CY34DRAFT_803549 [Suillus luteus UH-Slu-Lm8-n1]|uniref:Uncharacterized protein n=1 Tax=Suillus luteus UH-Slu-Lm8-n1 TaxID=930992 RepID=A0A0D0A196_9AGAM|nr:hypothetical protein CY34DRAFT_803549 [Suillus luteus UH-Slu-Lm8-n1]